MTAKNLILTIFITISLGANAQADAQNEALSIMRQLMQTYQQPAGVSFNITFKYSVENNRAQILDSLTGQCTMLGEKYWYRLDNTECIRADNYTIVFYKEDSLMYLAKPSPQLGINALRSLDSALLQKENVTYRVTEELQVRSLKLDFPASSHQKQVEYRIDKQTGYLISIINIVRKDLVDQQPGSELDPSKYAVIETLFFNHRQGDIEPSVFDPGRYFRKVGNEFVAVAPYERYHIMLGNPDLQ